VADGTKSIVQQRASNKADNKSNNRILEMNGERKTVSQWSDITGHPIKRICDRIYSGWSDVDALTKPARILNANPK